MTAMNKYSSKLPICIPVLLCLFFTFLWFGPAELYLSNRGSEEFWFSFGEVFFPLILTTAVTFVVFLIVLLILPTKIYRTMLAVFTAIAVLFVAQGLFLPNNYGSLNGAEIDWSQYKLRMITNSAIWAAGIAAAVIWALRKWESFRDAARFTAVLLIVVQTLLLTVIGISGDKPTAKGKTTVKDIYLTTDNLFTVSGSRNTIVILLDAFDAKIMSDLLERHLEEIQSSFMDFTFYRNTSGGATRTKYAIPYILTGKINDTGRSFSEYIKECYAQSPLFEELNTGKYSTGVYTACSYVDRTQTKAIDNLSSGGELHATSRWGLAGSLLKMTAFKYAPHVLKSSFWMYSFELAQWQGGEKGGLPAYTTNDVNFYHTLKKRKLTVLGNEPAFRFIHLAGTHGPFVMDENIRQVPHMQGAEGERKQALGSLRIVAEYIQQLKELNLYENTTMFVLADHGDDMYYQPNLEQNPLFMVKEAGRDCPFAVSEFRLSYRNVSGMMADALKGISLNIENRYPALGTRYFYAGAEGNNSYRIIEFASNGDAYDVESWHRTGKEFINQTTDIKYSLGDILYFGEAGESTARKYFVSGFTYIESKYVWNNGKTAEMKFDLGNPKGNLLLRFDYVAVLGNYQRVYLFAGNQPVANFIARNGAKYQCVIPGSMVEDGILDLRIEMPDAFSPRETGTGVDTRIMALAFRTISIDSTDAPFKIDEQMRMKPYRLATEITFGKDGNMDNFSIGGISQDHWTTGKKARIHFTDIDAKKDLSLILSYNKVFGEQQHVVILANGKQIADYVAKGPEEKQFIVPLALLKDNALDVEICLPDATKPDNGDRRELALWMKSIVLREADAVNKPAWP